LRSGGFELVLFGELSMTLAPASTIDAAMARPIPFDAPVTNATLPSSETCMSGS